MANLVAGSGGDKGQLSNLIEAICRDFRGLNKSVTVTGRACERAHESPSMERRQPINGTKTACRAIQDGLSRYPREASGTSLIVGIVLFE